MSPDPPRRSRADAIEDRGPGTPRRPRRTRSVLGRDEAAHYPATGGPETLFRDTSRSFRSGTGTGTTLAPHELDLLALKAELYDQASFHHRQTIDELSQQLADVQDVLSSTEAEVERVLVTNAKLHRQVKSLSLDQRHIEVRRPPNHGLIMSWSESESDGEHAGTPRRPQHLARKRALLPASCLTPQP